MVRFPRFLWFLALFGVGLLAFGMIWPTWSLFHSFDKLERNAAKVITAAELQAWATNLLAHPPATTTPRVADLGTNFPQKLRGLYRSPPYVLLRQDGTNPPDAVLISWGSGFMGHCGFEIGASNLTPSRGSEPWQGRSGVYFWRH
jgi:hypothetical protein